MISQQQLRVHAWKIISCLGVGMFVLWNGPALAEVDYFEVLQVGRFVEPMEIPDFSLPQIGGGEITLSDYKGQVVFLNFWATWCPYCVEEREGLEELYKKYQDRGVVVLAVSIDQGAAEKVQAFVEERELTFLNAHDSSSKTSAAYGVRGVPATIIIEPSGAALGGVIGPRKWGSDEAHGLVEQLLAEYKESLGL